MTDIEQIESPDSEPEPTCGTCAAWTGEECRCNPPVPIVVGSRVITVFPHTAASAWCLMHQPADMDHQESPAAIGEQNG